MDLREKLGIIGSDRNCIHLFREGMFWKAYEDSAYLFIKHIREYKPVKKTVKSLKMAVVSVGFPENVLENMLQDVEIVSRVEDYCVIGCGQVESTQEEFSLWKESIEEQMPAATGGRIRDKHLNPGVESGPYPDLINKIRNFRIESSTPLSCMLFLSQIQQDLNGAL